MIFDLILLQNETRIGVLSGNDSNRKMRVIVNGKQLIIQEICDDSGDSPIDSMKCDDKSVDSDQVSNLYLTTKTMS